MKSREEKRREEKRTSEKRKSATNRLCWRVVRQSLSFKGRSMRKKVSLALVVKHERSGRQLNKHPAEIIYIT